MEVVDSGSPGSLAGFEGLYSLRLAYFVSGALYIRSDSSCLDMVFEKLSDMLSIIPNHPDKFLKHAMHKSHQDYNLCRYLGSVLLSLRRRPSSTKHWVDVFYPKNMENENDIRSKTLIKLSGSIDPPSTHPLKPWW